MIATNVKNSLKQTKGKEKKGKIRKIGFCGMTSGGEGEGERYRSVL